MYNMTCKKCLFTWNSAGKEDTCPECHASGSGVIGFKLLKIGAKEVSKKLKETENKLGVRSNVDLAWKKE